MAQIQEPRYEQLAARTLGVKGPGTLSFVENSVFSTLALDTNAPYEHWYPQQIKRYHIYASISAGGGQYPALALWNTYQDQIVVVERLHLRVGGAMTVAIEHTLGSIGGPGGSAANGRPTDLRVEPYSITGIGRQILLGAAAFGTRSYEYSVPTTVPITLDVPFVLGYQDFIIAIGQTAAALMVATWDFHMRTVLPAEGS